MAPVANCSTFVRRHILELGEDRARLRPFAVLAESDFTGHGLKTVAVHVIRERILIEATRCLDGLRQNLSGGIAERHEAVAEGIKLFARRYCAIALEHIGEAGKLERRRRREAFHDDEAVENRTELRLDRRYQQPDHGAAEHLRRQPDLMRELPPLIVEPGRPDDVMRAVVDLGTPDERRVRAFEYMPGDRRVVRAAFFTVQETGQWIGSWTPWYGFVKLPAGVAYRLPAGAHIAAEIHYRHTDERAVDRGRIGLFLETGGSAKSVSDLVLEASRESVVPADAKSVRFHADTMLTADTTLLAMRPGLVPGLTSIEVTAKRSDGGTDVLLFAKDVPGAWPTPYIFRDPVPLRRGTTLSVTAYTSSARSPAPDRVRLIVSTYRRTG